MKDIGSIWNKWDLHIHSDASDGKMNCQEIIDKAKEEKLSVIALTDHHTVKNIDKIKELAKLNDIIVLSGIEFRTEYGQKSVHMIGLFPDNYNDIDLDGKFLTENILNPLGLSESMIIQKGKEADGTKDKSDEYYFKKGIFLVQVDFKTAANLIHQYGGIVIVHAGSKSNSIDEEMKHDGTSKKNVSIYDSLGPVKDELFKGGYIDICEIRNEKDGKEFYKSEFCKPSITASDAHEKSVIGLGSCWVKAEKNFNGLKQILNEPERVNFNNPEILERVESNPLKFIKQIKIKRTANATMNEIWYDNIEIELNPGLVAIIENISREVTSIQQRIDEYIAKRTELNTDIQNLSQIKQSLVLMQSNISQKMEEHKSFLLKYNLDINEVVKVDFRLNLIEDKIKSLTKQRSEIVESLDGDDNLYDKKKKKEEEKKAKENELNGPERMYQKYLSEIEKWNKRCNDILGDDQTEDTINYYKKIQHYINNNLEQELKNAQEMRNNLVQELVDLKKITLSTYNKLYAPVLDFVERFKDKMRDYPIQFSASFIVRDFSSRFFDIVSQSSAGSFNGKEQGFNRLNDEIDHVDFNDSSAILHFTNNINTLLLSDVRDNMNNQERDIESQLKKGHTKQELYDYIYQLDYIQPSFQLMMGDKQLPALSPGERGALLLLFYLFIDMDDKPLIIDQPEENLDNESVYNYLVHFIKEAKQKRQIIIVTHNPNLAVVCDADQIVEMKIDKSYRNKVSFQSGAIENSIINDRIVTILEGTYPAFNNRDCKYSIVEHKL